eukprot:CAMPEP_0175253692 /NCGR_PEP_ID=MMETSP0093-20121207/36813_1 /TAXON_ID=311494 /ORGANISM="Alexandrium monilatum, Strain CCMP3105" /LENGTH=102 /DNA_ID=CAMNT_0016548003 /DNA_START=38 /DNA_END=342 /DNA_ORIENTATION=-
MDVWLSALVEVTRRCAARYRCCSSGPSTWIRGGSALPPPASWASSCELRRASLARPVPAAAGRPTPAGPPVACSLAAWTSGCWSTARPRSLDLHGSGGPLPP